MSKKEVSSEYLRAKGLSEAEITVYSTILGLGNATIGEIGLVTKMDLPEIYVQVKQLEEIGYVKMIPGKVPRYIAMEPFLKDYAQFSAEVKLGLINIQDGFRSQVNEFITKIQTLIPLLREFCEREKTARFGEVTRKLDSLDSDLAQVLDNSFLPIEHMKTVYGDWASESIQKTIPAFEENLEKSKNQFVSAIATYADSLVSDSKEIRNNLEKATVHRKVLVAEELEKLKSEIAESIVEFRDAIVRTNQEISASYLTTLDEKNIAARENAAGVISDLIKNVITLSRARAGDISSDTAQMINNALVPLFRHFDKLQKDVGATLEFLLEDHSKDIANLARQTKGVVDSSVPKVLELVTYHLEESRDESAKFIDKKITEPFKELEKIKSDIGQDIAIFKSNLMKEAEEQEKIAKASLEEKVVRAAERIDLAKVEIKDTLGLLRIDVEDIIQALIKNILNENTARIEDTTEIMQNAGNKLNETLANTIFLLDDSGKTFDGIVNMSESVMPIDELDIGILYGDASIERAMKDILLRASEELILITPKPNTDFLYEIEKQPRMTNYQLISQISSEDIGLLTSLVKRGNVNVMNYKGKDFQVAIRDNEEILFAPKIHKTKNIAFVTANPKLFKLFYEIVNQKIFTKMKEQQFQTT